MKTLITHDWNPRKHEDLIKDTETLLAAFSEFGREIPVYDDGFGSLWVYFQEFGSQYIVRADSFVSALEYVYDEMEPVPEDELHEAYGLNSAEELKAADPDTLELTDGYSYQANATGTGVVNHGYYEGLQELTNELIDSLKLSIVIDDEE